VTATSCQHMTIGDALGLFALIFGVAALLWVVGE